MITPLLLESVTYDELVLRARRSLETGRPAHLHTTPPGCLITGSPRRAIVLEAAGDAQTCAWFSDAPIEALARPLAILLHGVETVPDDADELEPACADVEYMADRMRGGQGHFHILGPSCLVNPHPGQWTILFEDRERGVLESVSDDRPLAGIRLVEQLIYK
jgi:hypothetical protein